MVGPCKWVNTRTDLDNIKADFGEDVYKQEIQKLYDARMIWETTSTLSENDVGVTDDTHRVIESVDMETQAVTRSQQELVVDTNAYIFTRLGYTDGECRAILEI